MSLATNVTNLATRIGTEVKSLRVLINGNAADLSGLNTTAKGNLVAAINEVAAATGAAPATLTALSDVTITSPVSGQALMWNGTAWVNGDVAPPIPDATTTVKGIVELATSAEAVTGADESRAVTPAGVKAATNALGTVYQPLDTDLTAIAALTTTAYGRAFLGLANQAGLMALLQQASETVAGKVELATTVEATTGADTSRAVTPAGLKAVADTKAPTVHGHALTDANITGVLPIAQIPTGTAAATVALGNHTHTPASIGAAAASHAHAAADVTSGTFVPARLPAATETAIGAVELATTAEASAGVDTSRAVTAAGLKVVADTKQSTSQKGVAGGYASLDGGGKVPVSQLPSSVMTYEGVWNASTNVPSLADGTGDPGMMYRVGTAGTRNLGSGTITFDVGDYAIYNGAEWEKSDTTDAVASVNSKTGNVTITKADVGLGNVDNTSDAAKPVSTAQQSAINGRQPLDGTLTALAGLTTAANQLIYSTGADAFSMSSLSVFGRSLIDDANAAAGRTTLDVYSRADIGDPETNFVTVFEAAIV